MEPDLLLGIIPRTPALPLSRSLRIEPDRVHQLALLAHHCVQCRDAHAYGQLPMRCESCARTKPFS
eukprot:2489329-Prorocentrum_lima.AAC.1